MAVYKLFAEKDATIYSEKYLVNTGIDSILELSKGNSLLNPSQSSAARILIKFSDTDINSVFSNYIGTGSFDAYVKLYNSEVTGVPTDYTVNLHPIADSWDMGTGRYYNVPSSIDGVCWKYRSSNNTNAWSSSYTPGITGSFVSGSIGGGTWYTGSYSSQSFNPYSYKDINIPVTSIINNYRSGSMVNNGFVLKVSGTMEFDANYNFHLSFFSRDTNNIYPPVLELKWNDYSFTTGSIYNVVNTSDINVSISNNKYRFTEDSIQRFTINVRDKYPTRTFTTGSIFTDIKYLPTNTYYSIKDLKTQDVVIDFDPVYTKVSTGTTGNYFDVYMNGLEPSRYYKILIKTTIGGNTIVFDDNYIFKVE